MILRNEELILSKSSNPLDFHANILSPYKAETEIWFNKNSSLLNYFLNSVFNFMDSYISKSNILEKFFKTRPEMPKELKDIIDSILKDD